MRQVPREGYRRRPDLRPRGPLPNASELSVLAPPDCTLRTKYLQDTPQRWARPCKPVGRQLEFEILHPTLLTISIVGAGVLNIARIRRIGP